MIDCKHLCCERGYCREMEPTLRQEADLGTHLVKIGFDRYELEGPVREVVPKGMKPQRRELETTSIPGRRWTRESRW